MSNGSPETLPEHAARVLWEELERLDPTPYDSEPNTWETLSEADRSLYVLAMERVIDDVFQAVPTTTR